MTNPKDNIREEAEKEAEKCIYSYHKVDEHTKMFPIQNRPIAVDLIPFIIKKIATSLERLMVKNIELMEEADSFNQSSQHYAGKSLDRQTKIYELEAEKKRLMVENAELKLERDKAFKLYEAECEAKRCAMRQTAKENPMISKECMDEAEAIAEYALDFDCSCEQDNKCQYHKLIDEIAEALQKKKLLIDDACDKYDELEKKLKTQEALLEEVGEALKVILDTPDSVGLDSDPCGQVDVMCDKAEEMLTKLQQHKENRQESRGDQE